MNTNEIVANLIKEGATKSVVTVKNVTVTKQTNYVRLGISTKESVKGYVLNDQTGEYEEKDTNLFFSSSFAIGGVLRETEAVAAYVDYINNNPEFYSMLLSFAKLTIVQQKVAANEDYVNPFSSSNDSTNFDHDVIVTYVTGIELGANGKQFIAQLQQVYANVMLKKMEAAMMQPQPTMEISL